MLVQQIPHMSPSKRNLDLIPGSGRYRSYMFSSVIFLRFPPAVHKHPQQLNHRLEHAPTCECVSCDGLATCPHYECCGTLCDLKSTIQHLIHLQIYFKGNPHEHETVACVSEPLTRFWLRRLQSTSKLRRSLVIFGNVSNNSL